MTSQKDWELMLAIKMLIVFLPFIALFTSQLHAKEIYTICTTLSPPLSTEKHDGILDKILTEAFSRSQATINLVITPSERGLINANNGTADGDANRISGLQSTYNNLIQVQESNMTYEFVAFTKNKDIAIKDWSDLKGHTVGYITGWKIFDEKVPSNNIIKVDDVDQLFALLNRDAVDTILYYRIGGDYYLKTHKKNVSINEPPLEKRDMFLYLNKQHRNISKKLESALKEMKQDGTIDRIIMESFN